MKKMEPGKMIAPTDHILHEFDTLRTWSRGEVRAPHKPLLVLYALGRWRRDAIRWIPFADVDKDLSRLLMEFGPERKGVHPEYPFWRLQRDGVWRVKADGPLQPRISNTDAKKSELLSKHARGGFDSDILAALARDSELADRIAASLLDAHFPSSIHSDILSAVGLDGETTVRRDSRDSAFREKVLAAYEYRCGVTGIDIRVGNHTVGLDAAHIKWHQAGGPCMEQNGIALSVLHHKLFDRGLFTISSDMRILISDQATGSDGFSDIVLRYHKQLLRMPVHAEHKPHGTFLSWHRRWVFHGRPRP